VQWRSCTPHAYNRTPLRPLPSTDALRASFPQREKKETRKRTAPHRTRRCAECRASLMSR
jgi:hypothetical protein